MADIICALAVYALFAGLLLAGVKKEKTTDQKETLQRLNVLRGIFALEIVVGHVVRYEHTLLLPFGKIMIISVAFFFFVSAMGMAISFGTRGDYLQGFLVRKCGYLLALALVTYAVTAIVLLTTKAAELRNFLLETNWYIWELMIFYIIFYLIYRFVPGHRVLPVALIILAAITVWFACCRGIAACASAMAFPLGLAAGEYYEQLEKLLRRGAGKGIAAAALLVGAGSLLLPETSLIGTVLLRNLLCIGAILLLIYVVQQLHFDNPVLEWLTEYSTEIYLFQFVWLTVGEACFTDWKIRLIFVAACTLATALLMHFVMKPIKKMRKRHAV